MSNTQWQVLARRIENNPQNWSGGAIGSGKINIGQTDNAIASAAVSLGIASSGSLALSSPKSDSRFFFGTGTSYPASPWNWNTAGANPSMDLKQKRTHHLPDGSVIWDLSGNVAKWVAETRGNLGITAGLFGGGTMEFDQTNIVDAGMLKIFNPFGAVLNSNHGMGRIIAGTSGGVLRGGDYASGDAAGVYAVDLSYSTAAANQNRGFRCSFIPFAGEPSDNVRPDVSSIERYMNGTPLVDNPTVNIASGGNWDLGWALSDDVDQPSRIFVQVRRKLLDSLSNTPADYPSLQDPVYREGFGLSRLENETSWVFNQSTQSFENGFGKYVTYLVTATDSSGNVSLEENFEVAVTDSCPAGYVGVAGFNGATNSWNDAAQDGLGSAAAGPANTDPSLNTSRAFCVMKYTAKAQTSPSSPEGAFEPVANTDQTLDFSQLLPDSRPDGRPITNITMLSASSECEELDTAYLGAANSASGFALLSNTQWQMIARSIENTPANWSGNGLNSGKLNQGHSDNSMASDAAVSGASLNSDPANSKALAASASDSNGYFGTGQYTASSWSSLGLAPAAGLEQLRTHRLPNGEVIWDMSGNVWQWVKARNIDGSRQGDDMGVSSAVRSTSSETDFNDVSLTESDLKLFGSQYGTYSIQNSGKLRRGGAGGVARGGAWLSFTAAGIYATSLSYNLTTPLIDTGFRCVYMP